MAAALSNLVALDVASSHVSAAGVAMALASFIPAFGIEWRHLFLQPIWDAHKLGEELAKKHGPGAIKNEELSASTFRQAPWDLRRKLRKVMHPMDFMAAGNYFLRVGREGRRMVKWQMGMLVGSVVLIAGPKVFTWLRLEEMLGLY